MSRFPPGTALVIASGTANPAAIRTILKLAANSMGRLLLGTRLPDRRSGRLAAASVRLGLRLQRALHLGRNCFRRLHLLHQVVIPFALDLEVSGGTEFDGLDQVVVHVGIDAGLLEGVERRTSRAAADEPG